MVASSLAAPVRHQWVVAPGAPPQPQRSCHKVQVVKSGFLGSRVPKTEVLFKVSRSLPSCREHGNYHQRIGVNAVLSRDSSSPSEEEVPAPKLLVSLEEGQISWPAALGHDGPTELQLDQTGAVQDQLRLGHDELILAESQIRLGREQLHSLGNVSSQDVEACLGAAPLSGLARTSVQTDADSALFSASEGKEILRNSNGGAAEGPKEETRRHAPRAVLKHGHVDIFHGAEHLRVYQDGSLELRREKDGQSALISSGRVSLPRHGACLPESCRMTVLEDSMGAVDVRWSDDVVLRVVPAGGNLEAVSPGLPGSLHRDCTWASKLEEGFVCEFSVREYPGEVEMAEVTLDMNVAGYWFGGGHFMRQHWPLNLGAFEVGPFFPFDNGPNGLNTMVAAQWMTSKGLLVLADPDTPFFHVGFNAPTSGPHDGWIQRTWGVGVQNLTKEYLPSTCNGTGDNLLRLQARGSYKCQEMLHPLRDWVPAILEGTNPGPARLAVRFSLSALPNVKEATMAALKTLNRPTSPPPEEMVKDPIWTTWARYHANVSQAKVERFANEIVSKGLGRSVMEIDDKWQSKYGDFDFDPIKFPDPKAMVDLLHALGFKVTLWIMPFAEENSNAYKEGAPKGYFISSPATRGLKPGFFRWWQPVPAAALDVTNPEAVEWFVQRLKKLQADVNIDGFKFDVLPPAPLHHPQAHRCPHRVHPPLRAGGGLPVQLCRGQDGPPHQQCLAAHTHGRQGDKREFLVQAAQHNERRVYLFSVIVWQAT